jgi:hypothetical protein
MTKDELFARLQSIEWSDIEFKEASWAVPKSALETANYRPSSATQNKGRRKNSSPSAGPSRLA